MSIIMSHRHDLVFPDGTVQRLEWSPQVEKGDLVGAETLGITPEPSGKFLVTWIEDVHGSDREPVTRRYYLEKF